jgi:ATP-dependent RNA helicase SUPV3L1/SUV3
LIVKALVAHRNNQELLYAPFWDEDMICCKCDICNKQLALRDQNHQILKQTKAEITQKLIALYTHFLKNKVDIQVESDEILGELKPFAKAQKLKKMKSDALEQTVRSLVERDITRAYIGQLDLAELTKGTYGEISELDIELLRQDLRDRLERYKDTCVKRRDIYNRHIALTDYFDKEFMRNWDEMVAELRSEASIRQLDIEIDIAKSFDMAQHIAQKYDGIGKIDAEKSKLQKICHELKKIVQDRIAEKDEYDRLVEVYGEYSDFPTSFPNARKLKREIWFFCGPTNSGKTHAALDRLAASSNGVYLAPLRLLALEGQEQLQNRGVVASYLTGEERDLIPNAPFLASTIEMLDYSKRVETAVIDEIQLLSDTERGWAWTNALVGVPAEQVILTGSENAIPLVAQIAESLSETLHIRHFQRFNPLTAMSKVSLLDAEHLKPGTAIVCFSRKDVLTLKYTIEAEMPYRVSVIYGNLSPDVRRSEANRFRQRETDILVATNAIGMGLNLPIRKILFWTTIKHYNQQEHPLTNAEIQQIAGRAGRYGIEDMGEVGAFTQSDLSRIQSALPKKLKQLKAPCCVMPLHFHLEMLSQILHTQDLVHILQFFQEKLWFEGDLFIPAVTSDTMYLARSLRDILKDQTLHNKYIFASAPVDVRTNLVLDTHIQFAMQFASGLEVQMPNLRTRKYLNSVAKSQRELRNAEDYVKICMLYQWLSYRFPQAFIQREHATELRMIFNQYISRSLVRMGIARTCEQCDTELPMTFRFNICNQCFHKRKRGVAHTT